uniref:Octapeptin synthase subunit B n=2 Tax=Bacillales TaxID=1385 RepID=A0A110BGL6_NIACI|nr:Octapeptin synthase subunit B [Niallia circulans]
MAFEKESLFWNETFGGEDYTLTLLPYSKTPVHSIPEMKSVSGSLSADVAQRILMMSKGSPLAAYMILLAGVQSLLYKYTNEKNILLGMPVVKKTNESRRPINHVVILKNTMDTETTFKSLLNELKSSVTGAIQHQNIPFLKMTEKLQLQYADGVPIVNMVVSLNELHTVDIDRSVVTDCEIQFGLGKDSVRYDLLYNENLYHSDFIARAIDHLDRLLSVVLFQPELELSKADMLSESEKRQLLHEFNDTETEYARDKTIHQLIEEQAERVPDAVAVVFENERLTYRELNQRANRLARTLRAGGVNKDKLVGLMVRRSLEMVVGILGILKAGGAYVPIDPEYPEERIRYMLEDSGAQLLLTQRHLQERVPFAGNVIALDDEAAYGEDGSNLEPVSGPNDLAYVIYTSGTTGKPKGVMVEHHGLSSLKMMFKETLQISEQDKVVQFASLSFDASCWEIFKALFFGAALYIPTAETILDYQLFESFMNENGITATILPPTYAAYLNLDHMPGLQKLITGGSAVSVEFVRQWKGKVQYFNAYGPTEASIVTLVWSASTDDLDRKSVPIGRPIQNHRIYIVDSHNQLLPVGVAGELCIGGVGLARGYLNRPELTDEKFTDNPFAPGERMYKTGDLARWLPDGNIEYMGRIDHQVKIRGYRIELGEIEEQLLKIESVQEAIVIAREDASGQYQLCAYFVADKPLAVGELRGALSQELPGYMIPAHFVGLERMPLTPNGKIDRKALPAPEGNALAGREYVAPRTDAEKALADVWKSVLSAGRVGVTDHFFELGGDSIKSIQVSSRLHQAGYKLEIKDLFKYPTIAQLSPHIRPITRSIDQAEVTGEAVLTPIQRWFFEQQFADPHHFNQSVMLYRKEGFEEAAIRKVLQKVTEHHDALRMVFRRTENGYAAWNRGIGEGELYSLEVLDFRSLAASGQAVEAKANEIQSSIDLGNGPLVKAGLFHCADGDHLLVAIHHGVVDGVSWRILMEDIALGYEQAGKGEEIRFPAKTDAYRTWAQQLAAYAQSPAMESERTYWQSIAQTPVPSLPKDMQAVESLQRDSESMIIQISQAETEQLLKRVHRAYNTEMNDILLTALGMAVRRWTGQDRLLVNLEGHGRETILTEIDITRTVGWFTSKFPVVLELEQGQDLSYQIKKVKEHLRQIPNKGIGYGICRYLSGHADDAVWGVEPDIVFNYLGQFDQDLENNDMGISPYSSGMPASDRQARSFALEINGMVLEGSLSFDLSYSRKEYRKETMEQLASWLQESLQEVIAHCVAKERTELTPSDVQFKGLSIAELEQLAERTRHIGEIENIYTLTPMQKGMFFHNTLNRHGGAYIEQAWFTLQGDLNIDLFVRSWNEMVARHVVLRTNFYGGFRGEQLQIVYRGKQIEFSYEDLSDLQENERNTRIDKLTSDDKTRGFDLEQDALMRVKVIRAREESYRVLWTFHHILMDGWCLSLIAKELFETYDAYMRNEQPERADAPSYSQYIEWLEKQDEQAASRYWSEYLAGYESQTVLPQGNSRQRGEEYVGDNVTCHLDKSLSERMSQVAKQQQVTVNTLIQAAWGIVLQKYNGTGDAVFGSVVSGRSAEIPGIEEMIGLFINTIPVRVSSEAETSFADVMKSLQESALKSGSYDYYPLYEIQAQSAQKQNLIHHIMAFENYPLSEQLEQAGGGNDGTLTITDVNIEEQTNYDFSLIVMPEEELTVRFDYNTHVYERSGMERLMGHFVYVLEQVSANPHVAVAALELVTAEEKKEIFDVFNDTAAEYQQDQTIHGLFEEQARRNPDAIAVVFENTQLTYGELNERANRLARTLRDAGVRTDQLVGLMVGRSLEMIVGMMAIMKAGGAYIPIDPQYPEDRIRYMLEDSGAQILLTQRHLQERVSFGGNVLAVDDEQVYSGDGSNLEPVSGSKDLAYVIYTSGTTGRPKGAAIEHRGLCSLKLMFAEALKITEQDRVVQFASLSFDASCFEIFQALFLGAALYIPTAETVQDYRLFENYMNDNEITTATLPPNYAAYLNPDRMTHFKKLITGGSASSIELVRQWKDKVNYFNAYGPTEDSICTTVWAASPNDLERKSVPIGRPIRNHRIYIVDSYNKQVPVGVAGELCIAGVGLARGYLNRPDLTAEKFVDNPFEPGERMYRSGDLARWLPDGNIEYMGRIDHQVKIRGYRIELGEVEAHLAKVEDVQETIVIARADASGQQQLCAYFVAQSELTAAELRETLSQELPAFMIPSYFVQLPQMPLTPNGKVDRKALPAPEESLHSGAEHIAPRTPLEVELSNIWKSVLGLEQVGVTDSFFDIGGHSLRATTLASKVHKELNVDFPLRDVFRYPTIEEMAQAIARMEEGVFSAIPVAEQREHYPLSSAQKRLFILQQLEGVEQSYNMPGAMLLEGALDRTRFEEAFCGLITRHETLRTGFEMVNGEAVQRIYPSVDFAVEYVQASEEAAEEAVQNFVRTFDLAKPPLLRVGLVELSEERHILMFDMHHIISDGVSMDVLVEEFVRLYGGEELEPLRIQYKDYAAWQQSEAQQEQLKRQEAYWLEQFRGELPVLEMPTDYARPAVQSYEGDTLQFFIDAQKSESLKRLAAESGATLYMVLLAAYTVVLHKYTGQQDVVVGTTIAGRNHGDVQPLIGMFVNTLAIRSYPAGEKTFLAYLEEVKETTLGAYEHQNYPFEELVDKVQVARDLSRNPLFDTMFSLQNSESKEFELEGLRLAPYPSDYGMAKFDLSLDMSEEDGGLECSLEYATALYKRGTIERLAKHLEQLLEAIVSDPGAKIAALDLLAAGEKERIHAFNPAVSELAPEKTFHRLFEEQAERTPEATAVVYEDKQLSYGELNEQANRLACTLREGGIGRESIVGILADRSVDLLVGVMAVWKAGGAYVPLDPEYPSDRIRFMLEDSGATVLLTQTHLQDQAQAWLAEDAALQSVHCLCLDDEQSYSGDGANGPDTSEPHDLAYVIYTSGTTGRPKGVMIEHRSLVNTAAAYRREYRLNQFPVRLLQLASFSFDVFVGDIARTLYNGGTMVICPKDDRIDPTRLYGWIRDRQITIFESTPALIVPFMEYVAEQGLDMSSMELLITSSDSCSVTDYRLLQERYGSQFRIINAYGVTEAAIDSSFYDEPLSKLPEAGNVPIGKAWLNARFYIVDAHLNPVPVGVLGELCIGGVGVARGYLNRPELNEEKFVDSPFVPGERLYRTGDLARWMEDGNVDFIGRIDNQAKIRGYRIEIGEVETQLLKVDKVREAVVVIREDGNGQKALCAYFTAEEELQASGLRSAMAQELPGYMIPSYFVQLERLPLTPNGKIDRKALPAPEGGASGSEYTAPRTPLEAKLVRIWQEVLGVATAGVKDNFFDLGGHSLRATTLVSKIHKELNVDLPLRDVFRYATVEEMAQAIARMEEGAFSAIPVAEEREHYPLSSAQKRLFILHQLEGAEQSYNMPGAMLLEGALDRTRFEEAFRELIARHETLRTGFEMVNGEAVQRIYSQVDFAVEYVQASEEAAGEAVQDFVRTFDLAKPPLLRVGLVELAEERYILMFDMHHIISDGVSMEVLVEEFVRLYDGEELEPLRIQYKDYAAWQQSEAQQEQLKRQEAYWLDQFQGELPVLEMPTDYARPAVQSYEGHTLHFFMDAQKSESLKRLAAESGATLYMVLLAAYTIVLHKYTGQQDVVVGTPIAGRNHSDVQPLIGMFINTLAIRSYPAGEKTFLGYLEEVKETMFGAYEHQNYPFEELVDKVQVARDLSRNPLFDTMFTLQNTESKDFELEGLRLAPYPSEYGMAKFDLSLDVIEDNDGLEYVLEYATALYKKETVERLAKHFEQLLEAIASDPGAKIAALDLLTVEEQEQIHAFNPALPELAPEKTFHRLFEGQAARTPEATAVMYEDKQLTYGELNEQANRLAGTLREGGIGRESIVGILADRSVDLLVGVMAVWKAGGAYVPLDPEYPSDRIRFMLEDSGATVLLTQTHLQDQAQAWLAEDAALQSVRCLCLDDEQSYGDDGTNGPDMSEPHDLAYVIYTSGTTGRPKGVMIEHRSLVNTAAAYRREYRLDQFPVRLLQLASFSFDVFVGDIARTLYNGGTMVICPKDDRIDPTRLYGWIRDRQITIFESTPALIVPFMEYVAEQGLDMNSMELLITSSDSCSVTDYRLLQERYGSQFRIINAYGVTEAAIDSSFYDEPLAKLPEAGNVPIGKAWLNARFYIVDAHLNPVPVGVLGELCIGGVGVARGYLNRPELNEEKFVDSPFVPGERLYRTGDLARWMEDGNVDFIGRIDNQAKIRGYRIEIGEVETQLLKVDKVREAVVVIREDGNGQKALCAYYTAEEELQASGLRSAMSQELPGYMIPSYFVQLERLPLTPNGKIDRKALPAPEGGASGSEYTAPRTPLEAKLVRIWQEVLGVATAGVKDNFFDLGGHSLRATTLVSKIHKELNVDLPLRDVFRYATVEEMAQAIAQMEEGAFSAIPVAEERAHYPLSSAQKRLFIQHQLEGADQLYNMPEIMRLEGPVDLDRFQEAFRKLIARHETLRTSFAMVHGEPVQQVHDEVEFAVERSKAAQEEAADIVRRFVRPFDLKTAPLLRVGLVELEQDAHILMFDMHHIISDGVSMTILVEEFTRLYAGEELPPLRIQYKDYAVWQQSEVYKERTSRQEAYWLQKLAGDLPKVDLPTDYERPATRSFDGAHIEFEVDAALAKRLNELATKHDSTLYMVLLSAYTVLLSKYSGQEDIIVGTPVAGRTHADLEQILGMFVNTLAIRNYPAGDKTFLAYLEEVKESALGAFEHQDYPFEELVERLNVKRDPSRNPLFDTAFDLQNVDDRDADFEELKLVPYDLDEEEEVKFDLILSMYEENGVLKGGFHYCAKLFKAAMIQTMAQDLLLVLAQVCEDPQIQLSGVQLNKQAASHKNKSSIDSIEFAF